MARAWKFQDYRQKQKLGAGKCPWSVGWIDPDGKRRSRKIGSKSLATKFQRKLEGQLASGTYKCESREKWSDFREAYETKILALKALRTQQTTRSVLDHFERIVKPIKVATIQTSTIDDFVAGRMKDPGRKPGSKVSPATINHDLRHLKAILSIAHEWGRLSAVPKFRMVREPKLIGEIMRADHFEVIYGACDSATMPHGLHCEPGDWWRALLVFAMTTGWRIQEILSLRREDLDFKTGRILTRAADNKGARDDVDHVPAVTLEHLRLVLGFGELVFRWPHDYRTLWSEFQRIQKRAGVYLDCRIGREHQCTSSCHFYGFHALRRGYATMNADSMPAPVLQRKMRHRSFQTTLAYIGLADKMKEATERVYVPEFLREASQ